MIFRTIPDFCLQYDEPLAVLRMEWVAGPDMRCLRTSASQLMSLIGELGVLHLLLDMDSVPELPVADQWWLGEYWMPQLVALPLERLVLVIASSQVHNQLAIDALHTLVQPTIRFDAQYFSDSASGMDWLIDGSERLPALEVEWANRHEATPDSYAISY
ncbi:hypothetical protein J0X19_17670 [Hymenobacter sp. BT186]|uniref:STAS/SEC14 domain-containing protein n=1 Tax=Hymenobacter telluris TaxID=2816474 RepID=A0A939F0A2_9BACT|nr:hypothetical protein [Hymenobacter telluris]MBO0359795.1 hypothetical protein [Hymenobacter telluris]MBW3375822.1 hypothetical protein [Hymenobacter norwichensis]